jgi:colicin import membrane protein
MTTVLDVPEQKFEQTAIIVRDESLATKIIDQRTYDLAAEKFKAAAQLEKQIVEYHAPLKQKAHDAHKAICTAENTLLAPVRQAKQTLSRLIGGWDAEQERVRMEEQRRLEAEAKRRADEEALQSAVDAEVNGADAEEIEAVLSTPAPVQRVSAAPTYQKSIPTRENWSAEVVSLRELVKAAAANPAYLCYLQANESALGAAARSQKTLFSVPGCKAAVQRIATRGR